MGDILCVINPTAGNGLAARTWEAVQQLLQSMAVDYRFVLSPTAGALPQLVRHELQLGQPGRIIAVGGDGTVSEALNGFMPADIPLGVIPAGSGNDFARLHRLSFQPEEALRSCLHGHVRRVDIATVNDHYMLNVGGVGFDAEVAAETNRLGKRLGATLPYVISLFRALVGYRNAHVWVELDGECVELDSLLIAVGNGQYYGGGMHILPPSDPTDGIMDVCIGGNLTRREIVGLLPRIFAGTHVTHPKVTMRRARHVTIDSDRPLYFHADGEVLGKTPVTFEILPEKLRLLS